MRVRRKADREEAAEVAPAAEEVVEAPEEKKVDPALLAVGSAGPGKDVGTTHVRVVKEEPVLTPSAPVIEEAMPVRELRPTENPTTDDFAAMFGEAPLEVKNYYPGDKVRATIAGIGKDAVFLNLGAKAEGFVMRDELRDADGRLTVKLGDEIEAFVIRTSHEGIQLSTALSKKNANAEMLVQAMTQAIPVEGTVTETNNGGYRVDVMGVSAFCPHSQIALGYTEDPNAHVGQTYTFLLSRVEEGGDNVVVSRTKFLEIARAEQAVETMKDLKVGFITEGVVSRVANFGAFVDIGGMDGLVHVSEMSWSRVEDPNEVVSEGQTVRVKVMRIENIDDPDQRRIALSMKELDEDPWLTAARSLQIGESYTGTVQRLERFGAFVELQPGVDGLLHVSELVHGRRVTHPQDVLTAGDKVRVQIIDLDPLTRRISLSMKALAEDPWTNLANAYPPGTSVQGTVESLREFGIFVSLPVGVTALLPISQLAEGESQTYQRTFAVGSTIEATVLEIEAERQRMTLTRKEDADQDGAVSFRAFQQKAQPASSMGTFADLLAKRK